MANHYTNIGGVAKTITGGYANIGGIQKKISYGVTNIGGAAKYINFAAPVENVYTAQLYNTGDFSFQATSAVETTNKTLVKSYTGWMNKGYTNATAGSPSPWSNERLSIKNVYFSDPISSNNTAFWCWGFNNMTTFNWVGLNTESIEDMRCMFDNCTSWSSIGDGNSTATLYVGSQVPNLYWTFANCWNLVAAPTCGPNVTNMHYAYYQCYNLIGTAVIGPKVTHALMAYMNCTRLQYAGECGSAITNMSSTYMYCSNMQGEPQIGPNVKNLYRTFYCCYKLTGTPKTTDVATSMYRTYYLCYNITGEPKCGLNVTNFSGTYYDCRKLNGVAIIQNKVQNMRGCFWNCRNLTDVEILSNNITDMANFIGVRGGSGSCNKLNIKAAYGTNTWNRLVYTNTESVIGAAITWTYGNTYYAYNTAYNIYLYGAGDLAVAGSSAYLDSDATTIYFYAPESFSPTSPTATYSDVADSNYNTYANVPWNSYRAKLDTIDVLNTIKPISIANWFCNCRNIKWVYQSKLDLRNTTNMAYAFTNCVNAPLIPISGLNVINMAYAYANCYKINTTAACGPSVTNLSGAYYRCNNLTIPSCGASVTRMDYAYANCFNMTGTPVCGSNVTHMNYAYANCYNAVINYNSPVIISARNVTNMSYAFYATGKNTSGEFSQYYDLTAARNVTNMVNCFGGRNTNIPIQIMAPYGSATTLTHLYYANTYGLSSITWSNKAISGGTGMISTNTQYKIAISVIRI